VPTRPPDPPKPPKPTEPAGPANPENPAKPYKPGLESPKTGDETDTDYHIMLFAVGTALSLGSAAYLLIFSLKSRKAG
jgi:heme-binding NEAT domain protein